MSLNAHYLSWPQRRKDPLDSQESQETNFIHRQRVQRQRHQKAKIRQEKVKRHRRFGQRRRRQRTVQLSKEKVRHLDSLQLPQPSDPRPPRLPHHRHLHLLTDPQGQGHPGLHPQVRLPGAGDHGVGDRQEPAQLRAQCDGLEPDGRSGH